MSILYNNQHKNRYYIKKTLDEPKHIQDKNNF